MLKPGTPRWLAIEGKKGLMSRRVSMAVRCPSSLAGVAVPVHMSDTMDRLAIPRDWRWKNNIKEQEDLMILRVKWWNLKGSTKQSSNLILGSFKNQVVKQKCVFPSWVSLNRW
jgi:hypothetical protein